MRRAHLGVAIALAGAFGCAPAPPPANGPYTMVGGDPRRAGARVPDVSQPEWTVSRERFARMRSGLPNRPFVERVQVGISDPRSGRVHQARGAVAIDPGRAARLVLLGPGGTTALDVWITRDRYRLSIPALKLERRGTDAGDMPGLPLGFLRWWFLAPLEGRLVLARSSKGESSFMLRDGPATVTMRTDGQHVVAVRREGGRLEGLEWTGQGFVPSAGARGRYIDGEWGVRVQVVVEEVLDSEPDPAAFLDPDEKGTTL